MKPIKKKLRPEILIGCLDALCRANATVLESDPKLAADISQAIEALARAIEGEDSTEDPEEFKRKDSATKYIRNYDDEVVDILTDEVIYRPYPPKKKEPS